MDFYHIVEFLSEDTVDIVPSKWLNMGEDDQLLCYWPPAAWTTAKIARAARDKVEPDAAWQTLPCRELKKSCM